MSGCLLLESRRFHRCVPSVYSNDVASEIFFMRLRPLQIMARMSLLKVSTLECHHLSISPCESHTLPCLGLPLLQPLRIPTPRLDLMTSTSKTSTLDQSALLLFVAGQVSSCQKCRLIKTSVCSRSIWTISKATSRLHLLAKYPGDVQVSKKRQLMIETQSSFGEQNDLNYKSTDIRV